MVKAQNIYTADHFKAAHKTNAPGKAPYIATFILLVFGVFFSAMAFSSSLKAANADRPLDSYIMCISGMLTAALGFRIVKALVSRDKVFEKAAETSHTRLFDISENELVLTVDSEIEHTERHFVLSGICKVCDTGKYFIIYLYPNHFCMIGYQDITEGSPEELRAIFRNAVGDRLIMK